MREGWEIKNLVDVCSLITCGVAKRPQYVEDGIPFLSAKNVKNGTVVFDDYKYVSVDTHKELTKNNKPLKGDILYTRVGSFGEAAVIEDEIEFSVFVSLTLIKVDSNILNQYFLKYYLNSDYVKKLAKSSISGSGVGNLNVGTVRKFTIPIPPLLEQKRIVSSLDNAFEAIDKAKANAEQNLINAKELFESYLQGVFDSKVDDWEEKSLKELVVETCSLSYGVVQPGNDFHNGLPVVRPVDLKTKVVKIDNVKLMNPINAEKYKRTTLQGDELLLCVRGDTGIVSLITEDFNGANVTRGIVPVSFNNDVISLQFGYYAFISPFVQKQIKEKTYGAALMQINIRDVRQLCFIVPPIDEQKKIVQKLDALTGETNKLETIYQQKILDLEELKKSILQKAFAGELTTKEIAL